MICIMNLIPSPILKAIEWHHITGPTMGLGFLKTPPQLLSDETSPKNPETTTDDPGPPLLVPWILAGSWRLIDERSEPEVVDVSVFMRFLSLDLRIFRGVGNNEPKTIPNIFLYIISEIVMFSWWFTMVQFVKKVTSNKQFQVFGGGRAVHPEGGRIPSLPWFPKDFLRSVPPRKAHRSMQNPRFFSRKVVFCFFVLRSFNRKIRSPWKIQRLYWLKKKTSQTGPECWS